MRWVNIPFDTYVHICIFEDKILYIVILLTEFLKENIVNKFEVKRIHSEMILEQISMILSDS